MNFLGIHLEPTALLWASSACIIVSSVAMMILPSFHIFDALAGAIRSTALGALYVCTYSILYQQYLLGSSSLIFWPIALVVGLFIGHLMPRNSLPSQSRITVLESYLLMASIGIFVAIRYAISSEYIPLDMETHIIMASFDVIVSGLSMGAIWGRGISISREDKKMKLNQKTI